MGFFDKFRAGLRKTKEQGKLTGLFGGFTKAGDAFFDELEETLILADAGLDTAVKVTERLRERARADGLKTADELRGAFGDILTEILTSDREQMPSSLVILVIGVNGVGKTTSIGKLAAMYKRDGKKVLLCAADTFRAAAADQLEVWAGRAEVQLVRQSEGSDPAAVVFDACTAAKARGVDVLICDTAGRLHNKQNLMKELEKISRVITRELPDTVRETYLVIDATTGANGVIQAQKFSETAQLTGIILTKLDGTAKGGIVLAIAHTLGVPVRYVGVGEKLDDLVPFDAREFVDALLE